MVVIDLEGALWEIWESLYPAFRDGLEWKVRGRVFAVWDKEGMLWFERSSGARALEDELVERCGWA